MSRVRAPLAILLALAATLPWGVASAQGEVLAQSEASAQSELLPQDLPPTQFADDPPARVARLRYIQGPVSIATAGSAAWFPAVINRPLTTGDAIWTERDSRAEVELDSALLDLDGDSDLRWIDLDDALARLQLASGTLGISLRHLDPDQRYEIDAPGVEVSLQRTGDYRVAIDADNVVISVRAGDAEISSDNQQLQLHAGQQAVLAATGNFSARVDPLPPPDDFDRWREDRGRLWSAGSGAAYVAGGVIGYEELAQYGAWQSVPQYGYAWFPNVTVDDWAPYRYGEWSWIAPWGWTWVDDEPWGFAPFHYGRWAYVSRRWCWVPAPPRRRAVYAPALVAWVGASNASSRGVGWFPLAPGEVYVPAHRASPQYVERVNLSNSIMRPERVGEVERDPRRQPYLNRDAPRSVSAVPDSAFVRAQPVPGHLLRDAQLSDLRGSAARPTPPPLAPESPAVDQRRLGPPPAQALGPSPGSRRLPERSPQFAAPIQQQRAPEAPRVEAPRPQERTPPLQPSPRPLQSRPPQPVPPQSPQPQWVRPPQLVPPPQATARPQIAPPQAPPTPPRVTPPQPATPPQREEPPVRDPRRPVQ
jgi:hypothetical protein